MSAWVLPDHIADVLPSEARHIEELRRSLLDAARGYGYELVMPPLLEYLESLLTGTGQALDLQTFKLVDQLSGRTMGVRADSTPQVARIDAHLLNRQGVARLCYCGPALHTAPAKPHATREPLQFGAEIYGHAGREADLEVMLLAIDCLQRAGLKDLTVDLADAQIVRSLLSGAPVFAEQLAQIHTALASKDVATLNELTASFPAAQREALVELTKLYGDEKVLLEAENCFSPAYNVRGVLSNLKWLADHVRSAQPSVKVSFDLSDARGYAYYTGARFAIYAPSASDAVARGGRYDEVGSVFGRNRPAVGFSLDVKDLVAAAPMQKLRTAIRAPWGESAALREAIARLRAAGETVVCVLPGHEAEVQEFNCDRELAEVAGQWVVKSV
ncbi:ATP phosphoribosyltransferase regulatory subunit [Variovorax sp. PCZ-1]|uniref:ATP phosphoribosyltransferase regulatory subunit n=1 Tax=Variovorax sp. PCZ-1 TaxID=2835533 RepID=UPI001BD00E8B|nr:ATP phosphoribosyltransferase regulatory subunit [Variovorax sp. PCZ-1]MBS7807808.1 ATP phosphoribosyltransferase regulatory subunit [Variovorax sp. PCZ-1]